MKCPKCGYENNGNSAVCSSCYFDLKGSLKPVTAPRVRNSTRVASPSPIPVQTAQTPQDPTQPAAPGPVAAPPAPGFTPPGAGSIGAFPGPGMTENTSGMGKAATVPPGVDGWSWGGFLLNFIWAIANRTWVGLLCVVPYIGVIMCIVLGLKGNEWAWRNRRWDSVDHFKDTQRVWARWAIGLTIVCIVVVILLGAVLFPVFVRAREAAMHSRIHP